MNNKKGYVILFAVFLAAVVLSNMITAKYIEDRVNSRIRMEIQGLRHQINQMQPNVTYSSTKQEKKWNEVMAPTELAKYVDIELGQVYDIIDDKESEIPYVFIEGAYRFSKTAIDEWLGSRKSIVGKSRIY